MIWQWLTLWCTESFCYIARPVTGVRSDKQLCLPWRRTVLLFQWHLYIYIGYQFWTCFLFYLGSFYGHLRRIDYPHYTLIELGGIDFAIYCEFLLNICNRGGSSVYKTVVLTSMWKCCFYCQCLSCKTFPM